MSEVKRFEYNWAGRPLVVEIGEVAKQANGSCLVKYGETVVLSAVCSKPSETVQDFFPLMVLYQERLYASGMIPGGYLRREGRPTEHETLTSRLIDRPIRPLFAEGFSDEVQVVNTVLSYDPDCSPEMAAMLGSSIALSISDIPFEGPIAGVKVGYINGQYVINPTPSQLAEGNRIDLTVAGTKDAINMVESGSSFVNEDEMWGALVFGHQEIIKLCEFQNKIQAECGKEKVKPLLFVVDKNIDAQVRAFIEADLVKAIRIEDKLERYAAIDECNRRALDHFKETVFTKQLGVITVEDTDAKKAYLAQVQHTLDDILYTTVRKMIAIEKIRPDGRKTDEIRPLSSRVDVLPRAHGSALFTRGQTQSLGVTTLSSLADAQEIEGLDGTHKDRFIFHYNFPQFSVGETGKYGSPGRREIGHGHLAGRALSYIIPSEEEFPYTIRQVSDILESNGSSSQASICSGTLSLMAAGVPIKAPVAGIAMGLITYGNDYTILTDIQGLEDHLGDMDFKVAGTTEGITALQMDIKIRGISYEILKEALYQAKAGRLQILDHMMHTIDKVRPELSKYAPKVKMIRINPDKIKDVIGSGGKTINEIIEKNNNVKIDIEQDGRVFVMHMDMKYVDSTIKQIEDMTREVEVGKVYTGTVKRIEAYGVFVELWDGVSGLCHISRLANERVNKCEDVVSVGDTILVKVIKVNDKGQIDLSRKDALNNSETKEEK
jgi:polyribonucleotide nucleotidyltransferase